MNYFARKEQKFAFSAGRRAGYFSFSGGRRRASTIHVDVLPRLHLILSPSPYTNNSHFSLLQPLLSSPFTPPPAPSPSQSPFHYAILTPSPASLLSCLFPVSHLHSTRSRLTPSIGAFFISFSLRFLVIVRCFSPICSDMPRFLSFQPDALALSIVITVHLTLAVLLGCLLCYPLSLPYHGLSQPCCGVHIAWHSKYTSCVCRSPYAVLGHSQRYALLSALEFFKTFIEIVQFQCDYFLISLDFCIVLWYNIYRDNY